MLNTLNISDDTRKILDAMDNGMIITDPDIVVMCVNPLNMLCVR